MADQRIQYSEEMVGNAHPTKADTLNRAFNVEHDSDGTHGQITPTKITNTGLTDLSGASAGQVKFPAVQNASADVNTLDDYEEGTWTPTFACTTGSITIDAGASYGKYTKIGRMVAFTGHTVVTSVNAPTGVLRILGLPVAANLDSSAVSVRAFALEAAAITAINAFMDTVNGDRIILRKFAAGVESEMAPDVKAGSGFDFGGVYFV